MISERSSEPIEKQRFPDEVAVALCIYGPDLDPDQITRQLGAKPSHSHKCGETKGSKSPPFDKGAWILELRQFEPIDLDAMYRALLSQLPHEEAIWKELASRYEMRIDFAVHTDVGCGFFVSPETMALMSSKHCGFNVSIYAYGDNDD